MMRRVALAALFALLPAIASAQMAVIAPDLPSADSSNRIANSRFVQSEISRNSTHFAAGGTATCIGNALTISTVSPPVFSFTGNPTVTFTAGCSTTGATTLNVAASGAKNVLRKTATGLVALVTNDIINGQQYLATYDGTQYELQTPSSLLPSSASALGGVTSATAGANQFQNGISTAGAPTFAQPAFSNLSGSATASQLPAGVNVNVLQAKTANYPIVNTDCGTTISGSGGPWTLTLPAVAGFPATCVVQVCNADANDITHHAIRLSGFPAPSLGRLWMQQCEEVAINNGAWIVTKLPGRFRPGFIPTLFVDTGGSDTNDGLVSNAAANALLTVQNCWTIFQREMDLGTAQPTCSPTGGQTFNGGLSCSSAGTPNVYFLVGNGGRAIIRNTAGNVVVLENDFCGYIIFDNVTLDCTAAASHPCIGLFIHQQNGADLSTSGFTNGVNFTGALSTDTGISCDAMCRINTAAVLTFSGQFGSLIALDFGSMMDLNNGVTIAASTGVSGPAVFAVTKGSHLTWSGTLTFGAGNSLNTSVLFTGTNASYVLLSSTFAVSSAPGGSPTQWKLGNAGLLCNASATAVPGGAGTAAPAGFSAGTVAAATGGVCF